MANEQLELMLDSGMAIIREKDIKTGAMAIKIKVLKTL